jgi:carboxyl-terminal processing protease
MKDIRRLSVALISSLLAVGCVGGSDGPPGGEVITPADCTDAGQKQFVLDVMRDIYYWNDMIPSNPDLDSFATAEELLEGLVFAPIDRFSFIGDVVEDTVFFSNSQFIGVGLGLSTTATEAFVTQVFGDGPAGATDIARGDELLLINGTPVAEVLAGDGLSAAFGDNDIGVLVELRVRKPAGDETDYVLFKDLVTIEPVPATALLDVDGRQVGYLAFRDFVDPAFDALDRAFEPFADAGVSELILDLRYNGGGLLSVSEYLADLITRGLGGEVFYSRRHNDRNRSFDTTRRFDGAPNALMLDKIVIITTSGTASASELIINGITPYLDVTLVGGTTFGKPVGQYGYEFCGKILRPASFLLQNSRGSSDYFDGFRPDCFAEDDLSRPLGDTQEEMLSAAVEVVRSGRCTVPFSVGKSLDGKAARAAAQAAAQARRGEMGSAW